MFRTVMLCCMCISVCACKSESLFNYSDEERIAVLERRCRESAKETITEKSADGSVLLNEVGAFGLLKDAESKPVFKKFDEPIGAANLPALDLEYRPGYLLRNLMGGNGRLLEVVYNTNETGVDGPGTPRECRKTHYVTVRTQEESEATFLHKCEPNRTIESISGVRYYIGIEYGELDDYEIRPFIFYVKDRTNGRVLAEQRSYQLLMGSMKSKNNRVFHGWASSQGVRNCQLTPPDQLVKRVFW